MLGYFMQNKKFLCPIRFYCKGRTEMGRKSGKIATPFDRLGNCNA